jgi:sortase A
VFREGDSLLKVGVILVALAIALVIAAVVVSVALRIDSGQVGAAEVGRKLLGEAPGHSSSGEEGSASSKSSSGEDEVGGYSSGEESPGDGSSDSGGKGGAKELQEVGGASEGGRSNTRSATSRAADQQSSSKPEPRPQENRTRPEDQILPAGQRTPSEASSEPPGPQQNQTWPEDRILPGEDTDWPAPTQGEISRANSPRHYELLPGAIMSLTIEDIGIYNAPVFDSDGYRALVRGVAHVPETSLPWSPTPQRNVYLAGHRMGYRGTWSRMLFYNLDELREGDRIVLRDRSGRAYEYRVSESFLAEPRESWVMGQVRGRDMVSLQTCTPIPTFEKRLIVRADRV